MPVPTDPYNFVNGDVADADQVDARFSPLYAALDGAVDHSNMAVPKVLSAYLSAATAHLTTQGVIFNAVEFDTTGWYNAATGVFTPQVAGYYRISWQLHCGALLAADKYWTSRLLKDGLEHKRGSVSFQRGATATPRSSGTALVQANGSTTTFAVAVEHDVGGATLISGGAALTFFQAQLVGRS